MQRSRAVPRWLGAVAVAAVAMALLYLLRGALTPVFFGFLLAYICDPVVDRLEQWRIPRGVGIAVLLTTVLGAIGLFVLFVVPGIVADVRDFVQALPERIDTLLRTWEPWLAERGVEVPRTLEDLLDQIELNTREMAGRAIEPAGAVLQWLVGGTASAIGAAAGLLMVPVFAAYLLYDFDRLIASIYELVPHRSRPTVVEIARETDEVLGQFVRGQLLVMVILAVLYSVGYALVGVPLAVPIGIVAGLLSFIPYVGGAVALALAVLASLLHWSGWGQLAGVAVAYTVVQLLESFVVTPRVVGEKLGLGAVWVLFALLVGGELFGFLGVLLALPATAVGKIFVVRAVAYYRDSRLFLGDEPEADPVAEPGPAPDTADRADGGPGAAPAPRPPMRDERPPRSKKGKRRRRRPEEKREPHASRHRRAEDERDDER